MKNIKNYATIKGSNELVTDEVLFTKQEVLIFLEKQGCPMDKIKKIDWESCEYDANHIVFHNPKDMNETIDLYMKNRDIQLVTLFIDSDFKLSGIHNQKVKIVE